MSSKQFYAAAGLLLAIAVCHALWRSFPASVDPRTYPGMSPEKRSAEYAELRKLADTAARVSPATYLETLRRFDNLQHSLERAEVEEAGGFAQMAHGLIPSIDFLQRNYVNNSQAKFASEDMGEVRRLADAHPIRPYPSAPMDPFVPKSWAIVYLIGFALTFGRFSIEIERMRGAWWVAMMSDWPRFPFWLMVWPYGVFKYPTEIDVRLQLKRAYRFATLLIGSSISLAAAGCGPKRVKTEPDDPRVDATKTWHIDVDTITWPSYLGSNGGVFHPAPVEQSSATLSERHGGYAGLWSSVPLAERNLSPNYGREVDGYLGWNGKAFGTLLNGEVMWIGVTPVKRYRGDVLQFTGSVARDVKAGGHTVTPYFQAQRALPTRGLDPEGGFALHQGVRSSWQKGRFSGGASAELWKDSGAFGFDPAWFAKASANVGVDLGHGLRAEVPFRWSKPVTAVNDGRKSELQAGFRLALSR